MKSLLLLPLLPMLIFAGQNAAVSQEGSPVAVLGFKWSRIRKAMPKPDLSRVTPAPEMIPANKLYQRNSRVNNPVGVKDPNEDTIDGRSAALEKIEQEARTPNLKPVDAFAYRARLQNASTRVIEILFWEYQFIDPSNPAAVARRQFLCGVNIKPGRDKELLAFSLNGPGVINAESLASGSGNVFQEKVVINRVEYADGSIWQRKDWNFAEIKLTYQRAVASPWEPSEMCRSL